MIQGYFFPPLPSYLIALDHVERWQRADLWQTLFLARLPSKYKPALSTDSALAGVFFSGIKV